ncbi:DUF4366 domain-containing protein [Ructibacterium gallinarum]|uniref:DUF4366 domain-containing protein n=1 Tax=Ructibacterium gallinarum TaxID=2779355 RepID=A0A9D5R9U7_9FIRM|nr:DUF4366 domain-containing protein [Ructibacterium gallinarum]MBE5040869.1 DUF4366 domain-containing protein [Ructibacterium gallinarum]
MKNRLKLAAAVLSAAFALSGITAFAQSSEPAESTAVPDETVIEDNHTLTPAGNAQLMDDVTDNENLQFITVTARDGNEFYIIIDKGAQSENVYFLNTVDESDLAALVEDYAPEQTTEQQQLEPSGTPDAEQAQPEQEQPEQPEPEAEQSNSSFMFLIILVLAGGAGLAVYYFKVFRPKKKLEQADDIEDFEFEETENEEVSDEETEDHQK